MQPGATALNVKWGELRATEIAGDSLEAGRLPARKQLRLRFILLLLALDLLCLFGGFAVASLIYDRANVNDQWLVIVSVLVPVYVAYALSSHAYSPGTIREPGRGVTRAIQSLILAAGTVVLVAFYLKTSENFSRLTFAIGTSLALILIGISRDLFLRRARRILKGDPFSVVLIAEPGQSIRAEGASLVLPADKLIDPDDIDPMMYDRLAAVLKRADRVVVACAPERRMSWVQVLKGANIQGEIVTPELLALAPLGMGSWDSLPTLVVARGPLGLVDTATKRAFDLIVAIASIVLLSPVLLVVAAAIKLETRGPVFFVQPRIGRGNAMFRMLKFRSMRSERSDSHGHSSTAREDERVTRVGRLIRRTSLDELPQLFNVLMGDMSIVGPRPHALGSRARDKLFWEIDERYWHRHAAKPGLTGLAQVRGYRGATLEERDLTDRLQADLEYLSHWSLWKDIKILMMTFRVLVHQNAF